MRTITFISSVFLVFCFSLVVAQDKQFIINQIRKEYNAINKDKAMKAVVLNNEDFLDHMTDGGGKLTGFYRKGEVKKVVCWIGLSFGTEHVEYYFNNNKLIFVYEEFNTFLFDKKTQNLRYDATEKTFEGWYYFDDNLLIKKFIKGQKIGEGENVSNEKSLQKKAAGFRRTLLQLRDQP
jgi:hypothetical protein